MRFRDRFKKITKKKTSPNGSGIQNAAAQHTSAQQSQANETAPKVQIEDTPIKELWNVAYEKLREEDGALIAEYERILQCSPAAGSTMKDQLRIMLEKKMAEVNARVSKFGKGKTEAPATEVVSKIMGLANDYVHAAARTNSYTSIAWAGVGFILPLLINPSQQRASLAKAIDDIASLIAQSVMREDIYEEFYKSGASSNGSFRRSHGQYKIALESLYRQILKFEATCCCHYSKNAAFRLGLDAVQWNDWSQLVAEVRDRNNNFIAVENILRDIRLHEERKAAEDRQQAELAQATASKEAQEYTELLRWLCDIDPSSMYNAARDKHEDGTCGWLVQDSDKFKTWEESKGSLLWLHGKDRHDSKPSTALAYFYFSFSDTQKQNVDGMLASLIKQVGSRQLNKQLLQRLGEYMTKGQRPDAKTLREVLISSLSRFSDVYVVIDALDECPVLNERRERLLENLDYILANTPDSLHVFLTSRKEPDIDAQIRDHLSKPGKMEIDLLAHQEILNRDICHYIDSKLATKKFKSWPESMKMKARKSLLSQADSMFQYIQCQFEILQRLSSESEIYEALQKLPKGLDATYDRILESIDPDFKERVITSIKWLAFSQRTLILEELSEIFIIRPIGDIAFNENDRLFSPEDILEYFSGLIITQQTLGWYKAGKKIANEVTEVRLVHFSLKEYFISTRIVESAPAFAFTEVEAHISIVHACLAYLKQFSHEIAKCPNQYELSGLQKYTTDYWMIHLEEIPREWWPAEWTQNVALVLGFHSQSFLNQLRLGRNLRNGENEIDDYIRLPPYCFTARLGLYRFTQMLLSQGPNAYATQEDLDVALQNAAYGGNKEIMKLFLERGADVNAECGKWGSALLAAATTGNLRALELLVESGANVNRPSKKGRCLLTSLNEKSTQCLNFLLDSGADIEMQGGDDGTALTSTLRSRDINLDRFELLLERNANVNALGGEFYTPLQTACAYMMFHGTQHYVKSLLERGADTNIRGGEYGTALQAVCSDGSRLGKGNRTEMAISVIQLLINQGADVNLGGGKYGSAFNAVASWKSSRAIQFMKLLHDNGAEINQQGHPDHGTALHIACHKGSIETVRWLLDKGSNVNAESGRFATPLQAAVAGINGNPALSLEIAKLLIEKSAQVNQQGGEYGTALQAAYSNRNRYADEELRCLLLEHGADVNVKGGNYGTVLVAACGNPGVRVESVRLLLDRGVDVNADGGEYGTALIAACTRWSSDAELVRLLLDHGADINAEGGRYGTALAAACETGASFELISLLLERGADPRRQNCLAWHMAARSEKRDIVPILKLLLNYIDINHVHGQYGTALRAVIELWNLGRESILVHCWHEKARFLLESGANADVMAGKFGFALQAACAATYTLDHGKAEYNGDIEYACSKTKLLLEQRPDINVDTQGGIYNTALQAAAYSGQTASIRLLLDKKADCNIRGGKYGSALNAAIISGYWDIVEILLKAGATPDCRLQEAPDKEWLQRVREEDGRGAYERYMKFWEVQSAPGGISK
ncbi:hypothetical protein TRIATDRAFT_322726 [Trichoderma atroviride IMI 206040]|uniref:Uncharacterized protein n=1 Tax=Hypocrea atroviridis (strain ATCC 20476 / IMI 206040) TaxID=452589 RepID=G9P9E2_HYPAI|nr:uncharacterized protein TRIATDRAFT_322726 [Trichoderma atroviride IMI 206040]EHK40269.1 hypothetical protein TRIATDRAFT_322726 [Trichoderma atroviride IMI 206040]